MLGTIIAREIQEHLKSSKFQLGFLITIALISISTSINISDYMQRNQDYLTARAEPIDRFYVSVYKPPQVLSILAQGKDRKLGNKEEMSITRIADRTTGYMGSESQHKRYMSGFTAVDFAFVVRVVLSLMVIFLAYTSISEEKFSRTLSLVLSNPVPRDTLLLGKCLGGMCIITVSFIAAIIVAVLMMISQPSVVLGTSDIVRIIGMAGVSVLYLSVFYTMGLLVSILVNRPAIALMVLLQVWAFLIIIYPAISVIAAQDMYKIFPDKLNQRKASAFQQYEEEYKRKTDPFQEAFAKGGRPTREQSARNVEGNALRTEAYYRVDREFAREMAGQTRLAENLSVLSPAVLYDQVMTRYARTGMTDYERFFESVFRFWQEHVRLSVLRFSDYDTFKKSKTLDFAYQSETAVQSFHGTVRSLIILFLLNILFFTTAYVVFLRKDVR
ncbi:ABC transporter permease subunit [bacterium]|nr:ABC transporter permease subunit [bacterium]